MTSQTTTPRPRTAAGHPTFSVDVHLRATDLVEVELTGTVDDRTLGHLEDALAWALAETSRRHVVVDLAGVRRIGAAAFEVLWSTRTALAAQGRTFRIRGRQPEHPAPPTSPPRQRTPLRTVREA